jgi:hypothetical protein
MGRNRVESDAMCHYFSLKRLNDISEVHDGPEACILAVSDSGIEEIASKLSLRHTTLIHTAGSQPLEILQTMRDIPVCYGRSIPSEKMTCRHKGISLC